MCTFNIIFQNMYNIPTYFISSTSLKTVSCVLPNLFCYQTICFLWRFGPLPTMASTFLRFLDHTQQRITIGRSPMDEWSARRTEFYLMPHNNHHTQTSKFISALLLCYQLILALYNYIILPDVRRLSSQSNHCYQIKIHCACYIDCENIVQ
jgi:hypothetical protein